MSEAWGVVAGLAVVNFAVKATGPVLAGRRALPRLLQAFVVASVPALVAALVVTGTFADGRRIVVDERAAGLAAAIAAAWLRAPMLVVIVVAAATTGVVRAL